MDCILETRGLTKRFGRGDTAQTAVAGVDLHVRRGRVYGLLGPNGAGKSTTLKMLTGMLHPTEGGIVFDGHAWCRDDLYEIGSLIESAPIYPNLSAAENLRVRTTMLGLPESRIDEVLHIVDLTDAGKKRARAFSMGMKQRLGLALALLAHPKLLILDEPTNGLDPIGIEDLRALIRSFAEQGITVLVSSHILAEVAHVADDIGIIVNGHLAYEDELRPDIDLEALFMDVCRGVCRRNPYREAPGACGDISHGSRETPVSRHRREVRADADGVSRGGASRNPQHLAHPGNHRKGGDAR